MFASELHGICSQAEDGMGDSVIGSPGSSCYAATSTIQENSDTRFEEDIEKETIDQHNAVQVIRTGEH